jgi:hypothetical protein
MARRTLAEEQAELARALRELGLAIVSALAIDRLLDWLVRRL